MDLRPDISWWEGGRCPFVGDVKYEKINVKGIKHPDLYQLLAYTVAVGLHGGLLIYADGEGFPVKHEVVRLNKELVVRTLDLRGSSGEILAQIEEVGEVVRDQREATLRQ